MQTENKGKVNKRRLGKVFVVFWLCFLLPQFPTHSPQPTARKPATLCVLTSGLFLIFQPTFEGYKLSFPRHEIILHVESTKLNLRFHQRPCSSVSSVCCSVFSAQCSGHIKWFI